MTIELGELKNSDTWLASNGWVIRKKPLSEALPSVRDFFNASLPLLKVPFESTIFYRFLVKLIRQKQLFFH